jgi:hypothetical protein
MSARKLTPDRIISVAKAPEHVGNDGSGNAERGSHQGQFGVEFA